MVGGLLGGLWDLKESSPSLCVSRILSCCSVRSTAQPRTDKMRLMAVPGKEVSSWSLKIGGEMSISSSLQENFHLSAGRPGLEWPASCWHSPRYRELCHTKPVTRAVLQCRGRYSQRLIPIAHPNRDE